MRQRKFISHSLLNMNHVLPGVETVWQRNVCIVFSVGMEFDVIWIGNDYVAVTQDKLNNVYSIYMFQLIYLHVQ